MAIQEAQEIAPVLGRELHAKRIAGPKPKATRNRANALGDVTATGDRRTMSRKIWGARHYPAGVPFWYRFIKGEHDTHASRRPVLTPTLAIGSASLRPFIALAHFFQGKLAEARECAEEAFRRTPLNTLAVGLLAGLLKRSGEKEQAERLGATLCGINPSPLGMIIYHLACSEIDAAINCYEHTIEQRRRLAAEWAAASFFRPLRSSSR